MTAPAKAAAPSSSNTVETPSGAPNFGNISDSIAGWIEQGFAPLRFLFRTPWLFRFESNLREEAGAVWKHATTSEGINYELGPWMRMQFPESAPLPKEIRAAQAARKQRLLHSSSSSSSADSSESSLLNATHFTASNINIDSLLSVLGSEDVDGLLSTEATPVPFLFTCSILLLGIVPIDRHELGLDAVWKERIEPESSGAVAPTVAGFEERSQSILQRLWIHKRAVTHVDARAVAAASPSDAARAVSYTRVTDELEVTPRTIFFLLFPLLYVVIYLTFLWRHHRLRAKFATHQGPLLQARTQGLKTKTLQDFAVLMAARQQDGEEDADGKLLAPLAPAGQSDEEFELVHSPAEQADNRKDK